MDEVWFIEQIGVNGEPGVFYIFRYTTAEDIVIIIVIFCGAYISLFSIQLKSCCFETDLSSVISFLKTTTTTTTMVFFFDC